MFTQHRYLQTVIGCWWKSYSSDSSNKIIWRSLWGVPLARHPHYYIIDQYWLCVQFQIIVQWHSYLQMLIKSLLTPPSTLIDFLSLKMKGILKLSFGLYPQVWYIVYYHLKLKIESILIKIIKVGLSGQRSSP